jgi:hypothetical protein
MPTARSAFEVGEPLLLCISPALCCRRVAGCTDKLAF